MSSRRSRTWSGVAAGVLCIGLVAGCGADESGDNGEDVASAASPSAPGSLDLVAKMQAVAPHLDDSDLATAEQLCDEVDDGLEGDALVSRAEELFSDGPDDQVDAGQAQQLIQLVEQYTCSQ